MHEAVALTRELLALRTINPPGDEAAAVELLARYLSAAGLQVCRYPFGDGRENLVARLEGRDPSRPALCFSGHLDTVPLGSDAWTRDPFAGEIDGDRLFGRGASDMKAGVGALVVAAARLAAGGAPAAGLEVVLSAGEETGCDGALAIAAASMLRPVGAMVVAEPTANYPCVAHKGVVWLEARAQGKSAHGSMPSEGRNAVYALARAVTALEAFAFGDAADPHPLLGSPTLNVGFMSGGANINSVPDAAVAGIDVRTVPGQDPDALIAQIDEAVGPEIALTRRLVLPPVSTSAEDPWVAEVFGVIEPVLGEAPVARGMPYFTDAAALAPALGDPPTIILGPGEPTQAHATDEHCSVRAIEQAAEACHEIARRWCFA